jgi:hypothetical protein
MEVQRRRKRLTELSQKSTTTRWECDDTCRMPGKFHGHRAVGRLTAEFGRAWRPVKVRSALVGTRLANLLVCRNATMKLSLYRVNCVH